MKPHEEVHTSYRPTEAKYKGGAEELYVTYDLDQKTRGGGHALYPKVKRVYVSGKVIGWKSGHRLRKRTGREVNGVRVEYEQARRGYRRQTFEAKRGEKEYTVEPAHVGKTNQRFVQIVELPEKATNVHFYDKGDALPGQVQTGAAERPLIKVPLLHANVRERGAEGICRKISGVRLMADPDPHNPTPIPNPNPGPVRPPAPPETPPNEPPPGVPPPSPDPVPGPGPRPVEVPPDTPSEIPPSLICYSYLTPTLSGQSA